MRKGFTLIKILPLILLAIVLTTAIVLVSEETRLKNSAGYDLTKPTFYDDTNKGMVYSGAWKSAKSALARGGSYQYSSQIGSSVSLKVEGVNGFNVVTVQDKNNGFAQVLIDGYPEEKLSLYSPKKGYNHVYSFFRLPDSGPHTITLANILEKDENSGGNTIMFEGFETFTINNPQTIPNPNTPTPTPTPPVAQVTKTTTFEENNKYIRYYKNWTPARTSAASQGAYSYATEPWATAELTVNGGTGYSIYTVDEKKNGMFNLYLNDQLVGTYDTYSPNKKYNHVVGPFPLVQGVPNTIRIQSIMDKNQASSGNVVALDKIVISKN